MRVSRPLSRPIAAAITLALALTLVTTEARALIVTNLVSDQPGVATLTDSNLVNAWGLTYSPTGPFWVANNGTGTSTLYSSTNALQVAKVPLVVSIPNNAPVTGAAFNAGSDFNSDRFLFAAEDGSVSGWRPALGTTAETLVSPSEDNVYKGLATATVGAGAYAYGTNFKQGTIDVFKGSAALPNLTGTFVDPNLPSGFAPFGIQNINDTLYVTYAKQDADKHDDVPGLGNGYVDRFDLNGNLLGRLISEGDLNSPWGVALAPAGFANLGGKLLVGNFGDGKIHAYDPATGAFITTLTDSNHAPIAIDGLWSLKFGNGGTGGADDVLYFTAGPDGESHGLFGSIAVPLPPMLIPASLTLAALAATHSLRRRSPAH